MAAADIKEIPNLMDLSQDENERMLSDYMAFQDEVEWGPSQSALPDEEGYMPVQATSWSDEEDADTEETVPLLSDTSFQDDEGPEDSDSAPPPLDADRDDSSYSLIEGYDSDNSDEPTFQTRIRRGLILIAETPSFDLDIEEHGAAETSDFLDPAAPTSLSLLPQGPDQFGDCPWL